MPRDNVEAHAPPTAVDVLFIGCWFIASRVWLVTIFVWPDPWIIDLLWQLLPIETLEANLFESLWFLHSQPPLFNLLVGLALHLPGDLNWLRLLWWEIGLAMVLVVFASFRLVGMPRVLAHALVVLFSINPTLALYENFYFYTYPEAFCVLLGVFALLRRPWSPALYGVATCALVGFRALFQPVWAGLVAWAVIRSGYMVERRRVYAWLLAPVLLGALLIVKNGLLFGVWNTSSWYGQNLSRLPFIALGEDEVRDLGARGIVSRAFVLGPFLGVPIYPADLVGDSVQRAHDRYGARVGLTQAYKESGSPNLNNIGLIPVSRQLAQDAWAATLARPGPVIAGIGRGLGRFLQPASDFEFLGGNRARLFRLEAIVRSVLYPGGSSVLVGAWIVLAIVSSAWLWLRTPAGAEDLRAAAAFVFLTTMWVATVGNLAEFGENNRFRFTLDPMLFAWNVAVLWWFYARIVSARGQR
jgi:hypothetical protein